MITASLAPLLPGVSVADPALLKGGYSREMWAFDATLADGTRRPLILCADSAEGVVGSGDQALTRAQEAALLQLVHRAGLPVPEVLGAGDAASPMGRPYLVMERGAGTAAVGPLFRDPWYTARADELAARLAAILAAIHAVDATPVLGPPPRAADVAPRELMRWSTELAATPQARTPVVDRAVAWLGDHLPPPPQRVTLVHADFRTG
ncbi:MAG TPA: phosphotransferase, partial [Mycobacteriales bacterium]|nr:phosphotransferase [Mycobacteriales bacterium]